MADQTYVELDHIGVQKTFDNKYKAVAVKKISKAVTDGIDGSSKLTKKAPTGDDPKGLTVLGNVTISQGDKGVQAEVEWTLSYWPAKSVFGRAHSKTPWLEVRKPEKIDNDVNDALDALGDDFEKKIVPVLEKTEPQ